ncbi:MAG: GGDEF domain-containing protein [Patescibacteria group bacterium]|nr:GGDEF domain-containing protein [Patescibacteria group bacterium]
MTDEVGVKETQDQGLTPEKIGYIRSSIKSQFPSVEGVFKKSGISKEEIEGSEKLRELRLHAAVEKVREQRESDVDRLTQVYNLTGYQKRLNEELERSKRYGHNMTVVVADLNNLKRINDTQGHAEGDEYIQQAARLFTEVTRPSDIVARCGGDEYRVILTETNEEQANVWLERARKQFQDSNVSISMGLAEVDLNNAEESLKLADQRMYDEKESYKKSHRENHPIKKFIGKIFKIAKGNKPNG